MVASGEYQVKLPPHAGRRMLVAALIALCLFLLGLVATACAAEPLTTAPVRVATPGMLHSAPLLPGPRPGGV